MRTTGLQTLPPNERLDNVAENQDIPATVNSLTLSKTSYASESLSNVSENVSKVRMWNVKGHRPCSV